MVHAFILQQAIDDSTSILYLKRERKKKEQNLRPARQSLYDQIDSTILRAQTTG